MNLHADPDVLLLLERLLGWKASEELRDQLQDAEVIDRLQELEIWHHILNHAIEPRPGFVDQVMAELGPSRAAARRESVWALTAHGGLAALGCFVGLMILLGSGVQPGSMWMLPGLVSLAFGIGSARMAWRDSLV